MTTKSQANGEESEPLATLAAMLRDARHQAGNPSLRRIADQVGEISYNTVNEVLNGKRLPQWDTLQRLGAYFNLDQARLRELWVESGSSTRTYDKFARTYRNRLLLATDSMPGAPGGPDSGATFDLIYFKIPLTQGENTTYPDLAGAVNDLQRSVVVGGPGSGKTISLIHAARQIAKRDSSQIPFIIAVRDMVQGDGDDIAIANYLESLLSRRFQLTPPGGWVRDALQSGSAVVMLDGLDETFGTIGQDRVASLVLMFADEYPKTRIIVTSRPIGFGAARFSDRGFTILDLSTPSPRDVANYSVKLSYFHDGALDAKVTTAVANDTIRALTSDQIAPVTPLMISLAFAQAGYQQAPPSSTSEILARVVDTLTEKWDRVRHANRSTAYLSIGFLEHLAFLMVKDDSTESIEERDLYRRLEHYLETRSGLDHHAWIGLVDPIIGSFRERTGVLVPVTSSRNRIVYQFAIRSIMDFLAGRYIASESDSPSDLAGRIADLAVDGHRYLDNVSEFALYEYCLRHPDSKEAATEAVARLGFTSHSQLRSAGSKRTGNREVRSTSPSKTSGTSGSGSA